MTRFLGLLLCLTTGGIAQAENLLSELEYSRLTGSARREYVGGLRSAYAQYEQSYGQQTDYYAVLNLFPVAEAADRRMCLVGGVARYEVNRRCPTGGRECEGAPNSFLCGKIYGGSCVPRQPNNTISERCAANSTADITSDQYGVFSEELQNAVQKACANHGKSPKQCEPLLKKMAALHVKYKVPALAQTDTPAANIKPAEFDAKKACVGQSYGQSENVCAACAFDYAVAQRDSAPTQSFHSSTKWVHLLSAMSNACNLSDIDTGMYEKLFNGKTTVPAATDLLATYGSCDTSAYNPKGPSLWQSFRWPTKDGYVDPVTYADEKAGRKPAVDIHKPDRFSEAFGLSMREAYELFCPDGQRMSAAAGGFESRLKKMSGRLGLEVYRCASNALDMKKKMRVAVDRPCVPIDLASFGTPAAGELRSAFERSDAPQLVTMNYNGGTKCQILTGYDADGFTSRSASGKIEHISAKEMNKNAISILSNSCTLAPRSATRVAQAKTMRPNVQPAAAGR